MQQLPVLPSLWWGLMLLPLLWLSRRRPAWIFPLFFVAGVVWVSFRADVILQDSLPRELEGEDLVVEGRIADNPQKAEVGQKIDVSVFKSGDAVDITGVSRGKGFAGGVKRYHFRGGPKTHGQSDRLRAPGSVGSNTNPGRTFKGLRMAGHMGAERVTTLNLKVVQADPARNLLLVKGAVPGMTNGLLLIRKSKKGKK